MAVGADLRVAELVEHEQPLIAGAAEVAAVGRAFLLAIRADGGAVQVEHHDTGWATGVLATLTPSSLKGYPPSVS